MTHGGGTGGGGVSIKGGGATEDGKGGETTGKSGGSAGGTAGDRDTSFQRWRPLPSSAAARVSLVEVHAARALSKRGQVVGLSEDTKLNSSAEPVTGTKAQVWPGP